jgi:hypothetical protein
MLQVDQRVNDENGYLAIVEEIDDKRGVLCYFPMLGRMVWMNPRHLFTLDQLHRWDWEYSRGAVSA